MVNLFLIYKLYSLSLLNMNILEEIKSLKENKINQTKACSQYNAIGYFFTTLINSKSKKDFYYSVQILNSWYTESRKNNINGILFAWYLFITLLKVPLKFKTLIILIRKRISRK